MAHFTRIKWLATRTAGDIVMAENTIITTNETTTLARANRIAVQSTATGFKADFYRTHKHLATLLSEETGWEADESANKSAQREDFRKFAIEHSADIGILWNPADLRSDLNKRIPKYENDEMLSKDCVDMLWGDLWELNFNCGLGLEFCSLTADAITPVRYSSKGTDLSKLGILDGKYEKSGNWAWADIEVTLTLAKDGQEIYYITTCQLVSGQLKKPHLTKTAFVESLKESLKEIGLWQEESKESDKDSKVGLGDAEHEGLHMDMTAEEEAKAMAEAEEYLKKTSKKSRSKKNSDK